MTNDYKQLYEEKCSECEGLQGQIQVLEQDKIRLEDDLEELQEFCETCDAETVELTASNEEFQSQNLELEEEIERIKTQHGRQSSSYIEQIQKLQENLAVFKRKQVQLENQVERLLNNERQITNRADKAENHIYDSREEVVMLKSQLEDETDDYEQKILRLQREMKDSKDNNRVLMMQIERMSNYNRDDPNLLKTDIHRRGVASSDFLDWQKLGNCNGRFEAVISGCSETAFGKRPQAVVWDTVSTV